MENKSELVVLMEDMGEAFKKFREKHDSKVADLENAITSIEKKMGRPGATGDFGLDGAGSTLQIGKTTKGAECYLLQKSQRISMRNAEREGFDLGEFVKDSIVGSRKAMGSGPALVPIGIADQVIDTVREQSAITQAGAQTLVIDNPTNLARILGNDPDVIQHTENVDDITESDIDLGYVTANPKLLAAVIPISEELVQDSPNLNQVIQLAVAGSFAEKLDALIFEKLMADAGITSSATAYAAAVAQDPALWENVLAAVGGAMAYKQGVPSAIISAPADFIGRASQKSSSGGWLGKPPALAQMAEYTATALPAGTAFLGDFAKAIIVAVRSDLRLEVVRWKNAGKGQHALIAHARMDGYIVQPDALFKQLKTV
ncbi:phage major capsid protein [Azonexus hydrophilus]|uniref:Phage major capsid protein n=1 Tax=Azonexus hydrophilus TaxID=418702 RepID=A0ABZ2XC57_9RHOO